MSETSTDPKAELAAMAAVNEALAVLDGAQAARVLQWAADARGIGTIVRKAGVPSVGDTENGEPAPRFETIGDLHAAAAPDTEADRALIGGYWFQFIEQQPDFSAYEVNAALKNLGVGLKNITTAFETLKARKPAL